MRSIIMQGMELIPAPSMEKETTGSLLQYSPSSLFLSEVGESALQETTHSDGGAPEINHDAEHVIRHLSSMVLVTAPSQEEQVVGARRVTD